MITALTFLDLTTAEVTKRASESAAVSVLAVAVILLPPSRLSVRLHRPPASSSDRSHITRLRRGLSKHQRQQAGAPLSSRVRGGGAVEGGGVCYNL